MLDDLKRMAIFARVVEAGSFSAAARRLGIAKSAVSKHVSLLEKHVGVPLLNRTTRQLSLTDVGESYYQSCQRMVEAAEEAQRRAGDLQDEPHGLLRVTCPVSVGERLIAPLIKPFIEAHPALQIDLLLEDDFSDMVKEGIDVGIRVGWLPDSSLHARKLGEARRLLCASPDYLERRGTPKTVDDLSVHDSIIFTLLPTPHRLALTRKRETRTISLHGPVKTDNSSAVRALLLEGVGMAVLSDFLVADDIAAGRLVHLLPEYKAPNAGIFGVYQGRHAPPAKVRKLIDHLAAHIKHPHIE